MKKSIFFLVLLTVQTAFCEVPLPGKSAGFISVDNLENNGQLEFKMGEKTEVLEFGKDKAQYGMGLFFSRSNLPPTFLKSINNNQILQITFGNRNTSAPDLVTQFGALTVKLDQLPSVTALKMPFQDTTIADKDTGQSAFVILNSSEMRFSQEDQEKLKTTHFSESGELTLTPSDKVEKVSIPVGGKKMAFRRGAFTLSIDAKMGTPFSNEKGTLKGSIEIPVFWPNGTEANAFVAELAETSLDKNPEISPPKEAPRTLASPQERLKPKKDKYLKIKE